MGIVTNRIKRPSYIWSTAGQRADLDGEPRILFHPPDLLCNPVAGLGVEFARELEQGPPREHTKDHV
jgi:hypothetical protein